MLSGRVGASCPGLFILTHPPDFQSKIILLILLILNYLNVKLYQLYIIEFKFSCFLCRIVLHAKLQGRGGASCPCQFILTPYHLSIKVIFFANCTYFEYLNVKMYQL